MFLPFVLCVVAFLATANGYGGYEHVHKGAFGFMSSSNSWNRKVEQQSNSYKMKELVDYVNSVVKPANLPYNKIVDVEADLVKDVMNTILSKAEYRVLLNNPTRNTVYKFVKKAIQQPSQQFLDQRILQKMIAIEERYQMNIAPYTNPQAKETVKKFLKDLKEAESSGDLKTLDTVLLHKKSNQLIHLLDDPSIREIFDDIIKQFANHDSTGSSKDEMYIKYYRKTAEGDTKKNTTEAAKVTTTIKTTVGTTATSKTTTVKPVTTTNQTTIATKPTTTPTKPTTVATKPTTIVTKPTTVATKPTTVVTKPVTVVATQRIVNTTAAKKTTTAGKTTVTPSTKAAGVTTPGKNGNGTTTAKVIVFAPISSESDSDEK